MKIQNQHVLVTGATGGIGRAFSEMCAKEKAHVHLVLRKNGDGLANDLKSLGASSVTIWEADLGSREGVESLLQRLKNQRIDILFNNAGMLTGGLIEKQPLDDIYQMLQVNLNALIHLTRGLLPQMLERKSGKIINNSSVSAIMHFPCASTYAASKAAVAAFTDCLELELKNTGVSTLLLITPGIKTRMFDEIRPLYGGNMDIPDISITPEKYASIIRDCILNDETVYTPSSLTSTGFVMRVAKFATPLFKFGATKNFRR